MKSKNPAERPTAKEAFTKLRQLVYSIPPESLLVPPNTVRWYCIRDIRLSDAHVPSDTVLCTWHVSIRRLIIIIRRINCGWFIFAIVNTTKCVVNLREGFRLVQPYIRRSPTDNELIIINTLGTIIRLSWYQDWHWHVVPIFRLMRNLFPINLVVY